MTNPPIADQPKTTTATNQPVITHPKIKQANDKPTQPNDLYSKDVGCRSNFDPSRPLYTQDTSFSVKSSLTAVRQGTKVPSSDIFESSKVLAENSLGLGFLLSVFY